MTQVRWSTRVKTFTKEGDVSVHWSELQVWYYDPDRPKYYLQAQKDSNNRITKYGVYDLDVWKKGWDANTGATHNCEGFTGIDFAGLLNVIKSVMSAEWKLRQQSVSLKKYQPHTITTLRPDGCVQTRTLWTYVQDGKMNSYLVEPLQYFEDNFLLDPWKRP